ncbi:MAG: serine hydrolase, partial [Akkermansia sp.]|nr:serine hydrolase [Akkermansia sp.]
AAIEATTPLWQPPHHGYHPQTFGPMVDVLMLELTGQRVSDYWESHVRRPLGLEFYIGHVPQELYPQVAHLRTARMLGSMPRTPFYKEYFDANSPVHKAFNSINGYNSAREMNTPAAWQCGSPAKGGVASARGLAAFYQALLGRLPQSPFAADVAEWMSTPQCSGQDLTLLQHSAFTCGAMCEPAEFFPGGGFGHAGAGGSLGVLYPAKRGILCLCYGQYGAGQPARAACAMPFRGFGHLSVKEPLCFPHGLQFKVIHYIDLGYVMLVLIRLCFRGEVQLMLLTIFHGNKHEYRANFCFGFQQWVKVIIKNVHIHILHLGICRQLCQG